MERTTRRFWWCAVAGASLFAVGCTPGYVTQPTTYTAASTATEVQAQPWQDPQFVTARVNDRLAQIERRVRGDIATGQLPAEAINDFNTHKAQVLQTLAQATQDGVIDTGERQTLRSEVHAAAEIPVPQPPFAQPGAPVSGYGYYSGMTAPPQMQPQPQSRSYFDETWEWGF